MVVGGIVCVRVCACVGDGPLRNVVTIANGNGEARGYMGNPGLGDMSLPEAIGKGTLQVVKNRPDWPNPYNGITAVEHRDVDRDVGIYLATSEQRFCALAAATTINGILCASAGGYMVEQLPGCSSETIATVEQNLKTLTEQDGSGKLPTGLLVDRQTPLDICSMTLHNLDMQPLQQLTPKEFCPCTEERLFRAIRLLGQDEVNDIVAKAETLEARCQFCGKVYLMSPQEVSKKFDEAQGDPSLDSDFQNKSN
jgi:molecular chaperone Hsp33